MTLKEIIYNFFRKIKTGWQNGVFQKGSRITYDVVWNIILFFIIIGVVGMFFAGGVGAGYFASLVKDEEVRSKESLEQDVYNYEETSEFYFANNIYLGNVSSDLYREETTLDQVSPYVKNAIIATEDEYFETHNGVVPKAILRAVFQEVTNSAVKTGGSTLTQQLIKNQILTNEVSFERKAKEILLAMRLEKFFEKDEILEAYLNIVPFGRNANGQNIAGIQTAAQGIFGVDAKDINLAQAAFIAGLPQSPSFYTPFANGGTIKSEEGLEPGLNRMKSVLSRMLTGGYINEEQYNEAMSYDIVADLTEPTPSLLDEYPYLTNELKQRAAEIIGVILAKEDGYTEEDLDTNEELKEEYEILAYRELGKKGYRIHSTINKEIYDVMQEVAKTFENYGPDKPVRDINTGEYVMVENPETGEEEILMEPVQIGGFLLENKTGKIISFVGGRDFNIEQTNHATNGLRQNGSTVKPLLVYAPAMEAGIIQPGSIIADIPTTYTGGKPIRNYSRGNYGLVSVRESLYRSHNIPAVKTYKQILHSNPAKNYLEKMGFTSLTEGDYEYESAALGSFDYGVTVEENTNAYATFGNNGQFTDGFMIDKIETIDGEVVYQHESEPVEVFSPQTNYLMLDMMRDVLSRGTGTTARANLKYTNVDWAGKTGTTNNAYDSWFMGLNPNVTLGVWLGYDHNKELPDSTSTTRAVIWAKLVNAATDVNPELMAPSHRFESPGGLVNRSYCVTSGMLPSEICSELGLVQSDLYNAKFVPKERDDSLIKGRYVMVNGEAVVAGENTPEEFTQGDGVAFNPEWLKRNDYDKLSDVKQLIPRNASGVWANIEIPSTEEIQNDGKSPDAPTSVAKSGKALQWKESASKDVVGYRIYRAADPEANFKLIGNTTELNFNIPDSKAVYHVTAVDYFGQESSGSKPVIVGDFSEPEEPEEPEEPKKPKPDKPGEDEPKDPPPSGDDDGGGNNDGGNGDGGSDDGNGDNEDDDKEKEKTNNKKNNTN